MTILEKKILTTDWSKIKIPNHLIFEELEGKPIYYRGFKEVVFGKKNFEEVMGVADLQAIIISCIYEFLVKNIDSSHKVLTNEVGLHVGHGTNLSEDIAIFHKEDLRKNPLKNKYFDYPPKVCIEVDTNADLSSFESENHYYYNKTQKLLDWGVEEVIWVYSAFKKVMVTKNNADWITHNWDKEIEVLNTKFSILELLNQEKIWEF